MKILFIKLGALGGVLRATPLFTGLKKKYPESELHVVTKTNAVDLLEGNKDIDRLWIWENDKEDLKKKHFDWIINTEDDVETCTFAKSLNARKFSGPYLSDAGNIVYTEDVSPWYDMGKISRFGLERANELKKKSSKKYQEIYSEILGFPNKNYPLILNLSENEKKWSIQFRKEHSILDQEILIGINTGAGTNWPLKSISIEKTVEIIEKLANKNLKIVLLGGPDENERNKKILKNLNAKIINSGTQNTMKNFIKIINALDMIITSDTLALHIAAALNKRIVSFFGPTSAEEIELYGNGVKIKPDSDCYCCFQKTHNKDVMCIDEIKTEDLIEAALNQIEYIRK